MTSETPGRITRLLKKAREPFQSSPAPVASWRESKDVCALSDSERHLGHAIRADNHWIAYDAVHFNPTKDGFRVIGTFASIAAAKSAIEGSVHLDLTGAVGISPGQRKPENDIRSFRATRAK